ncbi:ribosome recycling factor [Patescibacteria group bacterium]|nr:ribosome recycling factor [Patescibacteria group bacterium]
MNYDFSKIKACAEKNKSWFNDEISLLRTGRATPSLVENIKVDYYGVKSPLKSVASIAIEDARTLRVKPWAADMIMPIEQAVRASELGIQAVTEKDIVRIIFPELTGERRKSLLKILNGKLEESRISLRRERDETWRDIQDKEKEGEIGEDEKFRFKDELQKIVDEAVKKLEGTASKKEEEIKN